MLKLIMVYYSLLTEVSDGGMFEIPLPSPDESSAMHALVFPPLLNTGNWKAKVCSLLESTPDFQKESSRLCRKCFCKVESLIKRSKDFEDGKREIIIIEVQNL